MVIVFVSSVEGSLYIVVAVVHPAVTMTMATSRARDITFRFMSFTSFCSQILDDLVEIPKECLVDFADLMLRQVVLDSLYECVKDTIGFIEVDALEAGKSILVPDGTNVAIDAPITYGGMI